MKTFNEYFETEKDTLWQIKESLENEELTEEQLQAIDNAASKLAEKAKNGEDLEKAMEEIVNEGILGSVVGGLVGVTLGSAVMKSVAKVLGLEKGILYDLLTSRVCCAAVGVVIGNRIGK